MVLEQMDKHITKYEAHYLPRTKINLRWNMTKIQKLNL